jgi:hypothetical protein
VEHCRRSHAGLYYADRWEFVEALSLLLHDADLRAAMGQNGKAYVNRHYRWSTILAKYERLFGRLRSAPRDADRPSPRERGHQAEPPARGAGNGSGERDRGRERGREQRPRGRERGRDRGHRRPRP